VTDLPVGDIARRDTVRLIGAAHHKEPALAPLADDPEAAAAIARVESATNGRLAAQRRGLPGLSPDEMVYHVPGWTWINAAFAYARPGGSRFNGPDRGAWYAAFEVETATTEVGFHLTRVLAAADAFHERVAHVDLHADFIGRFGDLRGRPESAALHADAATGYPAGQALARQARTAGLPGLVYPSVRRPGGTCLVALSPHAVQNVRPGAVRHLVWDGTPDWRVETEA